MAVIDAVRRLLETGAEVGPLERAAGGKRELAEALATLAEGPDARRVLEHLARLMPAREPCFLRPEGLLTLLRAHHEVNAKRRPSKKIGLYAGWDGDLEALVSALLGPASPGPIEPSFPVKAAPPSAVAAAAVLLAGVSTLPEPEGSSLAFALGRRGHCAPAHPLLGEATLARVAPSFLALGSMQDECFRGWSKVFPPEAFGRAAWARLAAVEEVSVAAEELSPLVPFASDDDLIGAIKRYHASWSDAPIQAWLLARSATIKPLLQVMMKRFTRELAREGSTSLLDAEAHAMSALGQMLAAGGETWSKAEAKVVEEELSDHRGAMAALDPAQREAMMLAQIAGRSPVSAEHLSWFPGPRIIEALLARIHARGEEAETPLFEALAGQGDEGEAALSRLLGDPRYRVKVIEASPRNEAVAAAVVPLLSSDDGWLSGAARRFLSTLAEPLRARVLDAHLAALPPEEAIALVAGMAHRPEALRWAEAIPSLPTTEPARRRVLSRPGALPALCAEIAEALQRAPEAVEQARARIDALAHFESRDERVRWVTEDKPPRGVALALLAGGPLDPIIPICTALGATAELAWGAVWWWAGDRHHAASDSSLWALSRAFGVTLIGPLTAAFDEGRLEGAEIAATAILAEHDAAGSWERLVRHVGNTDARENIVSGLITAVNEGVESARAWIEGALLGSAGARKVALAVIATDAGPRWLPALDRALAGEAKGAGKKGPKAKAPSAAEAREITSARALCIAAGPAARRGDRRLPLTPVLGRGGPLVVAGSVEDLDAAGSIRAMLGRGELRVVAPWGEHRIEGLSQRCLCLTPEGDRVLLWDGDSEITALGTGSIKELSCAPQVLLPDAGLSQVVPLPGGRLLAVCFAQNSTPLSLWSIAEASAQEHRVGSTVADLVVIDEARYALLSNDGEVTLRAIDTGRVLSTLRRAPREDEADADAFTSLAFAGSRWLYALDGRGALGCWDLAGAKPALTSSFEAMPQGRIVADPSSGWAVLIKGGGVRCFREGLPMRAVPTPWDEDDPRPHPSTSPRRCAVFVGPALLVLGGAKGIEAWDLEAGEHRGRLTKPCRALTKVGENQAWWGDEKGAVWEITLP